MSLAITDLPKIKATDTHRADKKRKEVVEEKLTVYYSLWIVYHFIFINSLFYRLENVLELQKEKKEIALQEIHGVSKRKSDIIIIFLINKYFSHIQRYDKAICDELQVKDITHEEDSVEAILTVQTNKKIYEVTIAAFPNCSCKDEIKQQV